MKNLQLNGAVPAMPDHFTKRMTDTLGGLEDMKRTHKFTVSAAIALAAMLALAGIACAAQMGILDYIFAGTQPGADSEKAVRTVDASAEGEYMAFTVHDYVFDGADLYANWTLEMKTDEPLVLIATGLTAEFAPELFINQPDPGTIGANNPMTDRLGGVWSGMNRGHFYDYMPDEPFEVTVKLALVRPDENAVLLMSGEEGEYPRQPVWSEVDNEVCWSWGYFQSDDEFRTDDGEHAPMLDARAAEIGYHDARLEYFEQYGFGETVERLEVKFTVTPDGWSGKRLEKSKTFALRNFGLTVEKAEFTGFGADIALTLSYPQPVENLRAASVKFTVYADGEEMEFAQQMDMLGDAPKEITCDLWSQDGCAVLPEEIELKLDTGESVKFELK